MVHDSQAYKKMDVPRERISRIFELSNLYGAPKEKNDITRIYRTCERRLR